MSQFAQEWNRVYFNHLLDRKKNTAPQHIYTHQHTPDTTFNMFKHYDN